MNRLYPEIDEAALSAIAECVSAVAAAAATLAVDVFARVDRLVDDVVLDAGEVADAAEALFRAGVKRASSSPD